MSITEGHAYFNTDQKADSILQEIHDEIPETRQQFERLESTIKSLRTEQPKLALNILEKGIESAKLHQLDTTEAHFFYLKGRIEKRIGEPDKAMVSYQVAKDLYTLLNYKKGICDAINEIGWLAVRKGNYQEARINFQEALSIASLADLPLIKAVQLNDIGVTYYYQKAYQKATEYYLESTKIREAEGQKGGLVISYNNLGLIYKLNKNNEYAIKYYLKGLKLAEERKDLRRIISLNVNLGNIYLNEDLYIKAKEYYRIALDNAITYKSESRIAMCQFLIGRTHNKIGESQQAIPLLQKSLAVFESLKQLQNKATTLFELGKAHYSLKRKRKGIELMEKGLKVEQQTNAISIQNYKYLAIILSEEGRAEKAFQYLQTYSTLKDSIESQSVKENIAGMQIAFEEEFKAKEQTQEIELLTQEQSFQKTRFQLLMIFFGVGLCFICALIWNLAQKTKFNTLLKKQQKELMQINIARAVAVKEAEKATKAKSEFLSSMSHEIRTPMNAVVGITNILIEENPRVDQMENLQTLKFSSKNLLGIINDILDFSKIESGNMVIEETDFFLETLLKNIVETFVITSKSKKVKVKLAGDFGELRQYLKGDPTRLTQIFTNLVGNAIKFTDEGEVSLIAKIKKITNENATIHFAVKDTGIGIPKDKLDHIFESFAQASDKTTRLYGGTGLGLAITKKLVELQGGKIQVTSQVGEGSKFFFDLVFPLGAIINRAKVGKLKPSFSDKTGLIGRSILLAEDNKINQLVAKKILSKWKVKLDIAENGIEVLEKLAHNNYDLILMDIQMPIMDGFEATKRIRKLKGTKKDIPIIALTASVMHFSALKLNDEFLLNDYVTKPFDPIFLYEKMYNCIHNEQSQQPSIAAADLHKTAAV